MSEEKTHNGINGRILHIDLTTNTSEVETPDSKFYRTYLGGGLLGTYYLTKLTKPNIDPLSEENVLIFAPSILTGAAISGVSRFNITAKSPLTNFIGDTQCGGGFGPKLKHAGYDAVIIKGKSENPVYLWITNYEV